MTIPTKRTGERRVSIRSILAGIDDSTIAPLVLSTAASLAKDLGAELRLVRVISLPPEVPAAAHSPPDYLAGEVGREIRLELQRLMDHAPQVAFGPPIVVEGDPWRRILDVARELDVDLIVVGSHRYHGLDRVLGTVAAKVVNHADRNVFVVHERKIVSAS